jgi:hypothetical protein
MLIHAPICPFLYLYPTSHPTGGVKVLQKAWDLLSNDVKAILRSAESNPGALNTVDLGPKRPFSVGECALWARLTGPQFAAQVEAVMSLVVAPANHRRATTVAKEILAIKYFNTTGHSIIKFLESPFAKPEALGGGALTKALAQEAKPGGPLAQVLACTRAAQVKSSSNSSQSKEKKTQQAEQGHAQMQQCV